MIGSSTVIWIFLVFCIQGMNPKATECSDTMRAYESEEDCKAGYQAELKRQTKLQVKWTEGFECRAVTVVPDTKNLAFIQQQIDRQFEIYRAWNK